MWARRALTLPTLAVVATLWVAALPFLLPAVALIDLVRGGPWPLSRCALYFTLYLACEVAGVLAAFVVWVASGVWAGGSRVRFLDWNLALQSWWANALYRGVERIFAIRTEVHGDDQVVPGPILMFIRHVSQADTLIPVVYVTRRHGIALRFVLKRELLWDPCLDVVGHRLPNVFVQRESGRSEHEVAAVQRLLDDLGPREGVLIYPEGTRFTPEKRRRILEKLAMHPDRVFRERAARLRHVLPPHVGGPLGLLERNEDANADVIFCAHTGLEAAGSPRDVVAGALVGSTVRVQFWRVPHAEIPRPREARIEWLFDQWERLDAWIGRVSHPSG